MSDKLALIACFHILIFLVLECACDQCAIHPDDRIDCHPEAGASQSTCHARQCCWAPLTIHGRPWCFKSGQHKGSKILSPNQQTCSLDESDRQDCSPGRSVTESSCNAEGCCWRTVSNNIHNVPFCYYTLSADQGYSVSHVTHHSSDDTVDLQRTGNSYWPADVMHPRAIVKHETSSRLHFKVCLYGFNCPQTWTLYSHIALASI